MTANEWEDPNRAFQLERERRRYESLVRAAEARMAECTRAEDAAGWWELAGQMVGEGMRKMDLTDEQGAALLSLLDRRMERVRQMLREPEK